MSLAEFSVIRDKGNHGVERRSFFEGWHIDTCSLSSHFLLCTLVFRLHGVIDVRRSWLPAAALWGEGAPYALHQAVSISWAVIAFVAGCLGLGSDKFGRFFFLTSNARVFILYQSSLCL